MLLLLLFITLFLLKGPVPNGYWVILFLTGPCMDPHRRTGRAPSRNRTDSRRCSGGGLTAAGAAFAGSCAAEQALRYSDCSLGHFQRLYLYVPGRQLYEVNGGPACIRQALHAGPTTVWPWRTSASPEVHSLGRGSPMGGRGPIARKVGPQRWRVHVWCSLCRTELTFPQASDVLLLVWSWASC